MPKRSASTDKLTIKNLSQEDQAWLKAESDRLGCDPENLVRMMIRQRMIARGPTPPDDGGRYDRAVTYSEIDRAVAERQFVPFEPERNSETVNEAEPSLDQIMSAGPSLLDEAPPPPPRRPPARSLLRQSASVIHMRQQPAPYYPRGGFDAFSETEFVGLNRDVIGHNAMGDARGNVMRDNLRHFGVAGTRSR